MERLVVKNFLSINHADMEIKGFNVVIGPQARGKSVLVKLLYFFKEDFSRSFIENVRSFGGKRELNKALHEKFEKIFPRAYWATQPFVVEYCHDDLCIRVENRKRTKSDAKNLLAISYPEHINRYQGILKRKYKNGLEDLEHQAQKDRRPSSFRDERHVFWECVTSHMVESEYSKYFEKQFFIPASRSFFANLQKNIFSFLASNIDIDPFLKEFGSTYEQSKRLYKNLFFVDRDDEEVINLTNQLESLADEIMVGTYQHDKEQDWIVKKKGGRVNLANASSGQQEALPMLLVLSVSPIANMERRRGYYIEEPEAHLFPLSQRLIVSMLTLISNRTPHQLFITTHSPYVLTAINNCILAGSVRSSVGEDNYHAVDSVLPKDQHLIFSDVGAWTIDDGGNVISVVDDENKIIGPSVIDGVSNQFEHVTNALLDIQYGN
jgi:predicted ATPase